MAYVCSDCGADTLKWAGKCPECGQWGTLVEFRESRSKSGGKKGKTRPATVKKVDISKDKGKNSVRMKSGIGEFDNVLGGGFVGGEVVLMSGEPGIGKSTLLLQVALSLAQGKKVLYVSAEESVDQLESRIRRLIGKKSVKFQDNLLIVDDIEIEPVIKLIEDEKPALVIVDSIQAVRSQDSESYPGSIPQVRICGGLITNTAKSLGIPVVIVGQINKGGRIAGPKILEHMVDCVVYFEGDEFNTYRILRSIKNRFGTTNEIGVFEMGGGGLAEVGNPSKAFLDENNELVVGSSIGAVVRGSRVIFVEIQALTIERDVEGVPLRRVANGIKKQRLDMICAVLSKRGGVYLGNNEVYLNVVGGFNIDEPVIDLAVCAAIKSAVKDKANSRDEVFVGEVGLTGQVRSFINLQKIVKEAKKLGFKKIHAAPAGGKSESLVSAVKSIRSL
ncbi:DNA repair protein RadA [Candidatus Dojkabacteria bacterium]|nr:DNA repair protein RadA [Candidatus Dojkabacteria bacterium]